MLARKYHAHHVFTVGLILIGLFLLAAPFVAGGESEPSESNERLRELLTERYDILKGMLATIEAQLQSGRPDAAEWRSATIAAHRAEAELCTTRAARIQVYEKLVEAMQTQQEWANRRATAGQIGQWQLAEARMATIEARIDLERARLAQHTSK